MLSWFFIAIERNTIKIFLDAHNLCAPEDAHRLFEFKIKYTTFYVVRLPVHLPNIKSTFFRPGEEAEKLLRELWKLNLN